LNCQISYIALNRIKTNHLFRGLCEEAFGLCIFTDRHFLLCAEITVAAASDLQFASGCGSTFSKKRSSGG
jgi:hypothetical protein